MKYERFTERVDSGFVSELDCRIAYNKLCAIEDKIENGELVSANEVKEKAQNLAVKSIMNLTQQHKKELEQARKEILKEFAYCNDHNFYEKWLELCEKYDVEVTTL